MTFSDQTSAIAFWWRRGKGHRDMRRTEKIIAGGRKGLTRTLDIYLAAKRVLCKLIQWWKDDAKHLALHYSLRTKILFLQVVWQGKKKFVISKIWALFKTNRVGKKSNPNQFSDGQKDNVFMFQICQFCSPTFNYL